MKKTRMAIGVIMCMTGIVAIARYRTDIFSADGSVWWYGLSLVCTLILSGLALVSTATDSARWTRPPLMAVAALAAIGTVVSLLVDL